MNNKVHITTWELFFLVFSYGILSTLLAVLTSDGWMMLVYLGLGINFFGAILFLLLILSIVKQFTKKKYITLYKPLVWSVLTIQVIMYLFNYGDCGDGDTAFSFTFIERIFGSGYGCHDTVTSLSSTLSISSLYIPVISLIYCFSFIILMLSIRNDIGDENTLKTRSKQGIKILVYTSCISVLLILIVLALYFR